jgi:hypothetical protein
MTQYAKNKLFWILFGCAILIAIVVTYAKTLVTEDYFVFQQIACDPSSESCFFESAEDQCAESDDPDCVSTTEDYVYKIVLKKASTIPQCTPLEGEENSCEEPISCGPDDPEEDCYYEYCEEDCAVPASGDEEFDM